jgi:hypothetical protein
MHVLRQMDQAKKPKAKKKVSSAEAQKKKREKEEMQKRAHVWKTRRILKSGNFYRVYDPAPLRKPTKSDGEKPLPGEQNGCGADDSEGAEHHRDWSLRYIRIENIGGHGVKGKLQETNMSWCGLHCSSRAGRALSCLAHP